MWEVRYISAAAEAEVEALPSSLRQRFVLLTDRIRALGVQALAEPHAKHVEGKLWELRISSREGIARSFYTAVQGRRVVILRTFVKKTQKLPRREIEIALKRLAELK